MPNRFAYTCAVLGILSLGCERRPTVPCVYPYCSSTGTILGKVTVAGEQTPITGAQIDVRIGSIPPPPADFSTVSDGSGDYRLRLGWPVTYENPPGLVQITLSVSKSGFEPVTITGWAGANESFGYDVPLTPTNRCAGPVEVAVSTLNAPAFSWTPACRSWFVLVENDSSGADQWSVITDSTNAISPPVVYGDRPYGARELVPASPLVSGTTYRVSVFRWTGPGAEDGELVGSQTFTP